MNFEEAVRTALENETKGREMYIGFQEKAKNSVTKKTFEFLANEELRHADKIKTIAETLGSENTSVPNLEAATLDKMKEIFGVSIKDFDKQVAVNSNDIKAHEIAMDFEKNSFDFYKTLAEISKDDHVKEFFNALMKEEGYHYELIEKAYNFIKDPKGFYSEEEGWLLEG